MNIDANNLNAGGMRRILICAFLLTLVAVPAFAADQPNIVFILADDLGYGDVGAFGQEKVKTPNLDRMAAEGMRLTQYYAGSTVCAPSRSCLLTGLHTGHTRVRGNAAVPLRPEDLTVAEVLRDAGYTTGCVGKWGVGAEGTTGIPTRQGFDFYYGYLNQVNAHFYYPPFLWRNEEKEYLEGNDWEKQVGRYSHDLLTDEALQFVRHSKDGPFFLYLAYTIPHAELAVPEDSMAPYVGKWPEEPHRGSHYGHQDQPRAAFAGMVSRLDRDIGRLLDLLRDLDIAENTLVVFSSDNGPHKEGGHDPAFFDSNGPLRGIKRDLYEGGIRVPTIAWWPGHVPQGATSNHISAFWDFFPTCVELAGAEPVPGLDGISMVPTLLGKPEDQRQHEYLYWEFYEQNGKQAVRWGDWKGVRLNVKADLEGPIELYDLSKDVGEMNDIAEENPEIVARMAEIMREARTESEEFQFSESRSVRNLESL